MRLPYELLRKNFKVAQLSVERDSTAVRQSLKDTANACLSNSSTPDEVLKNLDSMIARMRGLKRKLAACADEEKRLQRHSQARIKHLGALYSMQSLDDVKYEVWSRTRLDRLLVDYMLRNGYVQSATALAEEKQIEELVDTGTFMQMGKIRDSLRNGRVNEVLAWCTENKKELRRMGVSTRKPKVTSIATNRSQSKLEFMVRFQQYIELVRTRDQGKLQDAIVHAKKYLLPSKDLYPSEVKQAAGLLAFPPEARLATYSVRIIAIVFGFFTNFHIEFVCSTPLGGSCQAIHGNSQQPPLYPSRPTTPYCTFSRLVSTQNSILSLITPVFVGITIIFILYHKLCLSNMQHRAERTGPECSIRKPHQQSSRY